MKRPLDENPSAVEDLKKNKIKEEEERQRRWDSCIWTPVVGSVVLALGVEMGNRSKDLLKLEEQNEPSYIESSLLVCNNKDPLSQKKKCYTNEKGSEKILTSSIPTSQVLGRVKDFLGVMAEANKRLQLDAQKSQGDYDIEVLTGNEGEYIEMDLVLGVADLHTPEAVAAAEATLAGSHPILPSSVCSNGSDTED